MTEPWPAPMGDEENSRAERSLEVGEELVEALDRRGKSLLRGRDALGGTLHASLELHRGLELHQILQRPSSSQAQNLAAIIRRSSTMRTAACADF